MARCCMAVVMVMGAAVLGGCISRSGPPLANMSALERGFESRGFSRAAAAEEEAIASASPRSIGVVVLQGASGGTQMMAERVPAQNERRHLVQSLPGAFVLTDEDRRPLTDAVEASECARLLIERAEGVNAQWLLVLTSTTSSKGRWLLGGLDVLLTLGVFPGVSQESECQTEMLVVDVPARRIVRSDREREEAYQPANLWTMNAAQEQTTARATRRVMDRLSRGLEEQHDREHPQERWKPESLRASWVDG